MMIAVPVIAAGGIYVIYRRRKSQRPFIKRLEEAQKSSQNLPAIQSTRRPYVYRPDHQVLMRDAGSPATKKRKQRGQKPQTVLHYMAVYWRPYTKYVALTVTCLASYRLFSTLFTYGLKIIIDSFVGAASLSLVLSVVAGLLIALPIVVCIAIVGERLSARLTGLTINDIRSDIFEHLQFLSIDYYKDVEVGDVVARFSTDMHSVERGIAMQFIPGIVAVLSLLLNLTLMFFLNGVLALLVLFAVVPLLYPLLKFLTPRTAEANYQLRQVEGQLIDAVQENIRAQAVVKSQNLQPFMIGQFNQVLQDVEDKTTEANFFRSLMELTVNTSFLAAQVLAICLGAFLMLAGTVSAGTLIAFITLLGIVNKDVYDLLRRAYPQFVAAQGGVRRIEELMKVQPQILDAPHAIALPPLSRDICFDHVTFSYTGQQNHLDDLNLTIQMGQFVAFVGPSGAGKSTILNLLLRFYEVTEGVLRFDNYDIRYVTQASLRQQLGVVLQDTFLFNTTLLNNIRIANLEATEADIVSAAQAAELHEFVMTLPDGYQTLVGSEAGGRISGGQRQRIGIARALLRNPSILLLDEVTASLDAETAAAINATITALARENRTIISITHMLSSIVDVDRIYVLDRGQLVEAGTHHELIVQNGLYAQLWDTQMQEVG